MQVTHVQELTSMHLSEVLSLVKAATHQDKVAPLSEQVMLSVRDNHSGTHSVPSPNVAPTSEHSHFLSYAGTHLAGYAHLEPGEAGRTATAEVAVDPSYRHRGIGAELVLAIERVTAPGQTLQVWSHGDLQSARALATRRGYTNVRELWQMRRSLRPDAAPLPDVTLAEGFTTRHFVRGQDEEDWLRVNARAFVNHPEQGRMTRSDLDQRIAEPWFDAEGLILIEDTRGLAPVLAASHWTKVVPGDPSVLPIPPRQGEVYVVAVDPAYQGLGLGRTVITLGLAHLRERGLDEATLYVDAGNEAAIETYSRLDFTRFAVDIMYSRIVHPSV